MPTAATHASRHPPLRLAFVVLCALAAMVSGVDASATDAPRTVFFVTGAFDGAERLGQLAHDANLRIEFASRATGAVLAALAISVVSAHGDEMLRAFAGGAWLIARLPPGRYRVIVDDGDRREERSVWLTANALRTLRFVW